MAAPALADSQRTREIAAYDRTVDSILGCEPESLLRSIGTMRDARLSGDTAAMRHIGEAVGAKIKALEAIAPPQDLAGIHWRLTFYLREAATALEAVGLAGAGIRSEPVRQCHIALLDYYRELLSSSTFLPVSPGDVEALEQTVIPGLEKLIYTPSNWAGDDSTLMR